ncbi:MAG: DUF192 domain-containing protein [Candidatus Hadarchaeales archaeon]
MALVNASTGEIVAEEVMEAKTFIGRLKGLMLKKNFSGRAMLFSFKKIGRYSVHTMFMRFPIDLIYLDEKFIVVEIKENLKPWRFYRPKMRAKYLIEAPAGVAKRVKISHKLLFPGAGG